MPRSPLAAWFRWYFAGLAVFGLLMWAFYLLHLTTVTRGWVGWPVGVACGLAICVLANRAERRARRRQETEGVDA